MTMLATAIETIKHNQMMQAALVAAPVSVLSYSAREMPRRVYRTLKKLVSVEVRFNSDSTDFEAVARFLTKSVIVDRFSRNFNYQAETKWDSETYEDEVKHRGLTAGYGTHLGIYRRHVVLIDRHVEEGNQTEKFKEYLTVTFFTRAKGVVREFTKDVMKAAGTNVDEFTHVPLHINSGAWWNRAGKLPLRSMDTIFTANGAGQKLLTAMRAFEAAKAEHHRLGLPHHLGILLYGHPGCGKSSLIHALASAMGRSIYYLNLGAVKSDKELTDLVCSGRDWSKTLLVIEDFDAARADVESRGECVTIGEDDDEDEIEEKATPAPAKAQKSVTLSTMLNVLDGLISPDGLITIATTNHPEKLDEALRRPGRFDESIELGRLGNDEFAAMARLFGRDPMSVMKPGVNYDMTGADMRSAILKVAA